MVRTDWVRSSDYGASGLQGCYNAGFGDGNTLLFHGFMNTSAVLIVHLRNKQTLDFVNLYGMIRKFIVKVKPAQLYNCESKNHFNFCLL